MSTLNETASELLSTAAVVRRLSISEATIWRLEKKGQFPKAIMISARCKRWRAADIDAFVNDRDKSRP